MAGFHDGRKTLSGCGGVYIGCNALHQLVERNRI
jgi:hypothetical protein